MKRVLVALLVFMLSISLFAGGSSESSSSDSSGKIKLTFFETMTSPGRTQVLQNLIAEYESLNPNIEIELISPPYEQADNRLSMMLNSNQELDVIEVRDYTQKQFVNNGKLLDLTPYIENWAEKDDFMPVAHEISRNVDDTPYILTSCLYVKALLVRTDILEKYGVKATFFMIGVNVRNYPDAAREVISRGHEVGNHTYSHICPKNLNESGLAKELDRCEDALEDLCEYRPHLFRPPEGVLNAYAIATIHSFSQNAIPYLMIFFVPRRFRPSA